MKIFLEPGSLIDSDLSEFSDFPENGETRLSFFSKAALYISVNFWDFGVDAKKFAEKLMARSISGKMADSGFGGDCWELDAINGKAAFVPMPEV